MRQSLAVITKAAQPYESLVRVLCVHHEYAGPARCILAVRKRVTDGGYAIAAANPLHAAQTDQNYASRSVASPGGPEGPIGHPCCDEVESEPAATPANANPLVYIVASLYQAISISGHIAPRGSRSTPRRELGPPAAHADCEMKHYSCKFMAARPIAPDDYSNKVPLETTILRSIKELPSNGPVRAPYRKQIWSWLTHHNAERSIPPAVEHSVVGCAGSQGMIAVDALWHVITEPRHESVADAIKPTSGH
jgi:hypothetical protein